MVLHGRLCGRVGRCEVNGSIAQSVEQRTENPRVTGSIPVLGIVREWLSGRASPCQGEGREFESRLALLDIFQSLPVMGEVVLIKKQKDD